MCSPEAYAVFQVAQAVVGYSADSKAAKAVNQRAENTAATIRNNAIFSDNALIRKKELEIQKLSKQKFDVNLRAKQVLGTAKTKIGEKGIGGNIADTLIGDVERQRGMAFTTIDTNYENYVRAIDTNREETNRNYVSQVLSLQTASKPSFLPYALKAGVNIGSMYMATKPPNTNFKGINTSLDGASSYADYASNPTGYSGSK